jgi:hypothetical protein
LVAAGFVILLGIGMGAKMAYFPAANPLLSILEPEGITLTRMQLANPNTGAGLAEMVRGVEAAGRPVPVYLRMVADEYSGRPTKTARYSVGCYWEGERELGKMSGVVASRTGNIGRDEVVEVRFDPKVIDAGTLMGKVRGLQCYRGVPSTQAALVEDPEQQHLLANHPEFAGVLLTPLQRTKVNAALGDREDFGRYLSPAQLRMVRRGN